MIETPLLEIKGLTVEFPSLRETVIAVGNVDITIGSQERVGIVGESGSGKSTLAMASMGLLRAPGHIARGAISFKGQDLATGNLDDQRKRRRRNMAMVYQDPFTYLNPLMRIGDQVAESIAVGRKRRKPEVKAAVVQVLEELGLTPGKQIARKYPHQLSGGQRQRVVLAMALVGEPALVIADEPTTALDVTVQAQILRILSQSISSRGAALLLISHDLEVVRLLCDRIYVMKNGEVVESGLTSNILENPQHPYTRQLLVSSRREDLLASSVPHWERGGSNEPA
ncbi:ABC transporter ATP-binding protein [Nesterenkonia ebinurensis]|uniref:ABC transporter ATP-binding protein n=1 Tax=Nesterenkonia ebinurensis TaxID=2608252 RepID=UPI00123CA660|nr:ABC transporter ATP-binding protein [Nesterenkonia ebinurensis]